MWVIVFVAFALFWFVLLQNLHFLQRDSCVTVKCDCALERERERETDFLCLCLFN